MSSENIADLMVVGAGIAGLAHALAAAKRGLKVIVVDRDEYTVGASIRNFGLVLIAGLQGKMRERALKTREMWLQLADRVQFSVDCSGSVIVANQRDEWDVLSEFYTQAAAEGFQYRLFGPRETLVRLPMLQNRALRGGLWSQYEVIVNPREAIPALSQYLEVSYGVRFLRGGQVKAISLPRIDTTLGTWHADLAIVCPGHDFQTLYPELLAGRGLTHCKLQMLRTVPQPQGWRLPCALMSGLSLLRYPAFANCPSLSRLRKRLEDDKAETLQYGIHLIMRQGAAGDLILGNSHEYGLTPSPFNSGRIDELLMRHAKALVNIPNTWISEHWSGVYAHSQRHDHLILAPAPEVRLVLITSGIGMSVSLAMADEVVKELTGR